MNPGVYSLSRDDYCADPCDVPSLSASVAALLCNRSPAHAQAAHPKLNPNHVREDKPHWDVGTAAHSLILENRNDVYVVHADSWRTKAAKEEAEMARAAGQIPLLVHTATEVDLMVAAVREKLARHHARPPMFTEGKPEQTLVWEETGGVVCRARVDWLRDDLATVDDLKTTSRSANPDAYSKALYGVGGDVQAAFYLRGLEKLTGHEPEFRWAVVEVQPPYELSVVSPDPGVLTIGRKKVGYAIDLWRRCLERDEWPGYPLEVCYATLPAYEETRWLERELREEIAA